MKKQTTQNLTTFDWPSQPEDLQRQAKFYSSLGNNLTTEKLEEMNKLGTEMESIYSTAKICRHDEDPLTCTPSLELEPDLVEVKTRISEIFSCEESANFIANLAFIPHIRQNHSICKSKFSKFGLFITQSFTNSSKKQYKAGT